MVELLLLILIVFALISIESENLFYSLALISGGVFLFCLLLIFLKAPSVAALYLLSHSLIIIILFRQLQRRDCHKEKRMTSKSRFPYRYILILFMGVLCTPAFLSLPRVGILPANFIKTPGFRYLIEGYPASGLLNMVAVMLMEYRIVFLVIAVFSLFAGGVGLVLNYEKKDPTLGSFASNLGQGVLYDFRDLPVLIKLPIFILVGYLIIRGCLLQGGGVVAGFLLAYLLLPPFRSNRLEFIKNAHSIEFLYLLFSAALVFLIFLIFLISGFSESYYPGIFRTWERFAAVRIIFINIVTGVISYSYTLLIIKILLIENEIGLSDD